MKITMYAPPFLDAAVLGRWTNKVMEIADGIPEILSIAPKGEEILELEIVGSGTAAMSIATWEINQALQKARLPTEWTMMHPDTRRQPGICW